MYTLKATPNRRMVLIDIENMVGGGVSMPSQVHTVQTVINATIDVRSDDHIIGACGRFSAHTVGFEWKGPHRLKFRSGINGADLEQLDVLESEHVGDRFTEVILVSGDGIFTSAIFQLAQTDGINVTVVSRSNACSHKLLKAATNVINLDFDQNTLMEAA